MSELSNAWIAADHLHKTFFGDGTLSADEVSASGVRAVIGSTSSKTVRRIESHGEINGREANQTLSEDRFGNFHLSTTFTEYGGEHVQTDVRVESPPEIIKVIEESLFMRALEAALASRQ